MKIVGIGVFMLATLLAAGCQNGNEGESEAPPVNSVTLNRTVLNLDLVKAKTFNLVVNVEPAGASDKATWASSNNAVAEVSANGKVTAKSVGTATITATTTDGEKTASCTVTVVATAVEAFVLDHWQEYGYSAKPTKYIALSFDDGPAAGTVTQDLLAALATKKVKATFFLIGSNVRSRQTLAKAIFDAGHEIGNHSDGTSALGSATVDAITTSLNAATKAIKDTTGVEPATFRAPNVDYGTNLTQVCTTLGFPIIGVSLWSNDWQGITTEATITNVLSNPKDGDIINCHELANTAAAVPAIIEGLREKGFWIMTVGDLAIVKGKTLVAGTQYDSIK